MKSIEKIKEVREYCKENHLNLIRFISVMNTAETRIFTRIYANQTLSYIDFSKDFYNETFEITNKFKEYMER